eukprot:CAMPEP_0194750846 /NCGR_PEP_ID=MMETSP0323_2-20130528/4950_1 /TAXON_ID=2866 ORGANISM="Crypthecodinium cohnii, Strain Seligo" /NCGR_SAMPLE_ID=MMETSP0323_2 /ASSEMBLY_ACC=CAM_ASM_000346 /LENGTH=65 /DNA_ID=CAMNT_0039666949 /DNA_START=113 /DNA_END=310 /DNA_ORIENTATION=-
MVTAVSRTTTDGIDKKKKKKNNNNNKKKKTDTHRCSCTPRAAAETRRTTVQVIRQVLGTSASSLW